MNLSLARRVAAFLTALAATASLYAGVSVAASSVGLAPAASAQEQGRPGGGNHFMAKILMGLGLSDDQKNRIRELRKQAEEKNQNVTDRDQRRANMKEFFTKMRDVLTPQQRAKFDAQIAAWRKSHPMPQGQGQH